MHPRQKRQCSRLAGLALLAVCYAVSLMALAVPSALADGGSVTFERRDYTVVIHSDGDLSITEHWQVHFAGQSYHHAFLRLYLARTAGIDIGSVAGADPGSQQISQTTDQSGNPMRQVAWDFPPTQDATRTFDIPYTVHGALGVGAQYAWLDWHFLDGASQVNMPIHASEITLTIPPAGTNEATIYEWSDTGSVVVQQMADQPARVLGQDLSANTDLEVEAVFPRAALDATVSRQPWQAGDEPPTLPTPRTGASTIAGGEPVGGGADGGSPTGIPTTFESGPPPIPLLSGLAELCQQVCAGFLPLIAIGGFLLLLLRGPRGGGPRLGGPWGRGPWYGGPWGGGGFGGGGGMGGGGGGMGGGGGGMGGGGGSMGGGGGGGGASGFS